MVNANPELMGDIAGGVAQMAPGAAGDVAGAMVEANPDGAADMAAAVAENVPGAAGAVAGAMLKQIQLLLLKLLVR